MVEYNQIFLYTALIMSDDSTLSVDRERTCGYCFEAHKNGVCDIGCQVESQAINGAGASEQGWIPYIARVKRDVLPQCIHPDQLEKTLNSVVPAYMRSKGSTSG